jgi:fibronectin type 3 domain-containing protein
MRGMSNRRLRAGRVVTGVVLGLMALAGGAFAAHPSKAHLSARKAHKPASFGPLMFRVSPNGRTMHLAGRTAFMLTCRANGRVSGRFQVLVDRVTSKSDGSTIKAPVVTIKSNGTFYGAGMRIFKPKAGPREILRYHFAGRVTANAKTAIGKFVANNCSSDLFNAALARASFKSALAGQPGLVAAYGFDEGSGTTVTDASGNGNNGSISNATRVTSGKYGGALQFNGTNSLVTIPDSSSLHLSSALTLEAWVNPSTVNANWRDVIYKAADDFYLEATSSNASKPDAGLIAGGNYADAYGTSALSTNTWSYLTETYDGSTLRLYVNGTQVASTAHTGAIATSTNPLQIGGDSLYGQYFAGQIDEVRVYNVALTPSQIQTDETTPINQPSGDTTPPTQPGTLSASAASSGEIDLSWGASTDNVGVTGYDIERCQGSGCTNFSQIGTATGTTYRDTTVSPSTTYSYRVRATDAAGNLSAYSNTASGTTPAVPSGLVAAYGFNEGSGTTVSDASGNGNNGTISNATWSTSGKYGGTLQFNGTNSLVTIPDSPSLHLSSGMTLEAWVNPSTVNANWRDVLYKANDNFYLEATSSNGSKPDGGLIAGGTYADAYGTSALATNTWSFLTETYDGSTLRLYVNGTQVASTTHTGAIATSTNPLQIGGDSLYGQYFAGMIDEVRVYNVALTAAQIQSDEATAINPSGPDTTPPSQPGTLAANAVSSTEVDLSWGASTDNVGVMGYDIERCSGTFCTNFTQIATATGTTTTYKDTTVGASTAYNYRVRAFDAAGNLSAYSNTGSATTPGVDTTPPTQPGTLTANAASSTEVDLSWGASTDNVGVTSYAIERCTGSGCTNFSPIASVNGATVTYKDSSVSASTSYSYRVRATDAAGNLSPYSNTASATTPTPDTTPPTQPATLTATAISSGEVDLSWSASTDNVGVTGYEIDRCQNPGCQKPVNGQPSPNFAPIATVSGSTTTFKDTSVIASTFYSYEVRAFDAAGNDSPFSPNSDVTTPGAPSGLVAAYGFDEGSGTTVTDLSGNGNNGTVSNATWSSSGMYGKALQFNGTNSTVTIPNSSSLQLSSGLTLEAWVNPSTVNNNWRDVIYKANDNFYLEATSTNSSRPDGGLIGSGTYADAYGSTALLTNTWSYLAETYDGSAVRLYVNGTLVATTAHSGAISTSTNPLQIGGDSLYGQYFAGLIDEVRIYNSALTAAQIQADEATPVDAPTAPGTLTASPASPTEIDLTWGPAGSSKGVSTYDVERCQGSGCTNFSQIGTTNGTTTNYQDTSVTANNTYGYRVRAVDSAGNAGEYSNVATATTFLSITPGTSVVTFTQTAQFTARGPGAGAATWSVDGVAGGNTTLGTITSSGLYAPPNTVGTHTVTAASGGQSANATVYVSNSPGDLTYHNDTMRTGADLNETVLTPSNVKSSTFGKLFSYPVDGLTFASPLYVANVNIPGQGYHNIVIVATEHDSVYAFDADGQSSTPLWHVNFTNPAAGITTIPAADTGETGDIPNEIGITGTPVMDPSTNTIYVIVCTKEVTGGTTNYVQRLHALDLTTGAEKLGGPVVIQASVPGTGDGSSGGTLTFNALREDQRAAGLLANGVVYFGWSSHGDQEPFHGWVIGFNASTLQPVMVYCSTPNAHNGGVWMDGDGVATDSTGSLYFITGDGTMDANTGGNDYGDSFMKLSTTGTVQDYFSPSVQTTLEANNLDLGSGGVLLLPNQPGQFPHEMLSAGKNGTLYLVNRDNMGGFHQSSDQIIQELSGIFPNNLGIEGGNFSSPVYWNGHVYFAPVGGPAQVFSLTNGLLSTSPTSKSSETYNGRGGTMQISANGSTNGILWTLQTAGAGQPGVLHAYDATNLSNELYNSSQAGTRDQLDEWDKFTIPVVANGKVFVETDDSLTVYGPLP